MTPERAKQGVDRMAEGARIFLEAPDIKHVRVTVELCDDPTQGGEHDHAEVTILTKDYYRA